MNYREARKVKIGTVVEVKSCLRPRRLGYVVGAEQEYFDPQNKTKPAIMFHIRFQDTSEIKSIHHTRVVVKNVGGQSNDRS